MQKTDRVSASERRAKFITAYLATLNATQAAIAAGFSRRTAGAQGSRLLKHVDVVDALAKVKTTALKRTGITANRVLDELFELGFSDIRNYRVDDEGNLAPAEGKPEAVMAAVSSIKRKVRVTTDATTKNVTREYEIEFRLWDKPGALKLAGRHVGLFPSRDQAAIEAAMEAALDKRIEAARQARALKLAEQENLEAERQRAIDVGEVSMPALDTAK